MSFRENPPSRDVPSQTEESISEVLVHVELEFLRIVNSLELKAEQGVEQIASTSSISIDDLPFLAMKLEHIKIRPNAERPLDSNPSYVEFRGEKGKPHRLAVIVVAEEFGLNVFDDELFQQYQEFFEAVSSRE